MKMSYSGTCVYTNTSIRTCACTSTYSHTHVAVSLNHVLCTCKYARTRDMCMHCYSSVCAMKFPRYTQVQFVGTHMYDLCLYNNILQSI